MRVSSRWRTIVAIAASAMVTAVAAANQVVVLETGLGEIRVALLETTAPRHVASFLDLVGQGFYDGTTFHRVIPGWIVQGGSPTSRDADPDNDNGGGPGFQLEPEFSELRHVRGAVAMARDPAVPASAGSQFFIVLADAPLLDEIGFTIFGWVTDGIETVDRIAAAARDVARHDRPLAPVVIRRIRVEAPVSPQRASAAAAAAVASPGPTTTATPAAARASSVSIVRITQDLVNVRSGAGTSSRIVARLRSGAELTVRSRDGRWFEVELGEGRNGWVREDMVDEVAAD